MMTSALCYSTVPSPFGEVAILWVQHGGLTMVDRVVLPSPAAGARARLLIAVPQARPGTSPLASRIVEQMIAFFAGKPVRFALDDVALHQCSDFQRRVLLAEYAIPRGSVSTYGLIARHLGVPGAARAVGSALAHNPFPILIPCHRAIGSDGALGGYQGGIVMKRRLLEMEGISFTHAGRVVAPRIHYPIRPVAPGQGVLQ